MSGHAALAIGGSAGSLPVIAGVLAALAADTPLATVVCVHTRSPEIDDLCRVLGRDCALPVVEARERCELGAGQVYVAAHDYHLLVERSRRFSLCVSERVNFARPSIDVVFTSMAESYRERLIGLLASGANRDGAAGLARIQALGGTCLVQAPASAASAEMPAAALALITPAMVGDPAALGEQIARLSAARAGRHG